MIIQVFKNALSDIWEESLFLIIFNFIWAIGTLPTLLVANIGISDNSFPEMILAAVLFLPWAFLTFGLFYTVYDISEGKVVKLTTMFKYIRRTWRLAAVWGIINIIVVLMMILNFIFYGRFEAQWAFIAQIVFLILFLLWGSLQLIVLPLYPRLAEPSFRIALRNAGAIYGRYPFQILLLVIIVVALVLLTIQFPIIGLILTFCVIAVLANRMIDAIVQKELDKQDDVK